MFTETCTPCPSPSSPLHSLWSGGPKQLTSSWDCQFQTSTRLLYCSIIHLPTKNVGSIGPKLTGWVRTLMWDGENPRWKKHDSQTVPSINHVGQQRAAPLREWCGIFRPPLALSPTHFTANEPYTQYQHPGATFNSAKSVCRSFIVDHCQSWFMAQLQNSTYWWNHQSYHGLLLILRSMSCVWYQQR